MENIYIVNICEKEKNMKMGVIYGEILVIDPICEPLPAEVTYYL